MKNIFIRVDGNNNVGYGHLFRCIALAEMLKNNFSITFIEKDSNEFAKKQMLNTSSQIIHLNSSNLIEEANIVSETYIDSSSILLIDGYQFTSVYQKKIKKSGATLVCIDDLHEVHFYADVIINQAYGVTKNQYITELDTIFCLGFDWVIQRPSFVKISKQKREIKHFETIFFTLGGSPIFNIAPKIILAIDQLPQIKRIVFLKGNHSVYEKDIEPLLHKISKEFHVYEGLNDLELSELLNLCDIAICPASVISLEACSVGIGLYVGITASNQNDNYQGLIRNNLAFPLGDFNNISVENLVLSIEQNLKLLQIKTQIENQKQIFNGESKERFLELFKSL